VVPEVGEVVLWCGGGTPEEAADFLICGVLCGAGMLV